MSSISAASLQLQYPSIHLYSFSTLTPNWFCGNHNTHALTNTLGIYLKLTFTLWESITPLPVGLAGRFHSPL